MHVYKWPINCTRTRTVKLVGGIRSQYQEEKTQRQSEYAAAAADVGLASRRRDFEMDAGAMENPLKNQFGTTSGDQDDT